MRSDGLIHNKPIVCGMAALLFLGCAWIPATAETVTHNWTGGSGQDFTLTVIPEPGVLALLGLAGLGLVWMRRRRV